MDPFIEEAIFGPRRYTTEEIIERLPSVGHGVDMLAWKAVKDYLAGACCCPQCDRRRERD